MWFSGKRRNRVRRQPAISWTLAVARLPALNWRLWGQAALVLVLVTGATFALRTVLNQPIREQINEPVQEALIVELYSK